MPIHTYICVYRRVQENVVDSKSVTLVPGDHGITYMCVCVYVYVCVCVCIHIDFIYVCVYVYMYVCVCVYTYQF